MNKCIFRKPTLHDMDLIFEWANDPMTRYNSLNQDTIPYETHVKWFSEKLNSERTIMLILEDDNLPIGVLRLDIICDNPKTAEISYNISPLHRHKGYGKYMICSAKELPIISELGIQKLIARVKESNISSQICFEKAGYLKSSSSEGYLYVFNI